MMAFPGRGYAQRAGRVASRLAARAVAPWRRADLAVFHQFATPPSGGGHQFLRALIEAWKQRGYAIELNAISGKTRACLLNSFNFDADRFRFLRRADCRTVHRVDGPLAVYRGSDDGTDAKIAAWNREFAQATVVQSRFSLQAHAEMGIDLRNPVIIPNAADLRIFYPPASRVAAPHGKLRVISASWSDNRNKGADIYEWLDRNLCFDSVEYTFVGRLPVALRKIRVLPPVNSFELAALLRQSDVYLTASRNDPCSNSLIEALSCGLPAIYLRSGGHAELVGEGGLGFDQAEEIPLLLERMADELDRFRSLIRAPRIEDVAARYLSVLEPEAMT